VIGHEGHIETGRAAGHHPADLLPGPDGPGAANNLCKPSGKEARSPCLRRWSPPTGRRKTVHDRRCRAVEFGEHRRARFADAADPDRRTQPDPRPAVWIHPGALPAMTRVAAGDRHKARLRVVFAAPSSPACSRKWRRDASTSPRHSIIAAKHAAAQSDSQRLRLRLLLADRAVRLAARQLRQTGPGQRIGVIQGTSKRPTSSTTCMCSR